MFDTVLVLISGGVRGTVVPCTLHFWSKGRTIDYAPRAWFINTSHLPRFSLAQYSLALQNRGLKQHSLSWAYSYKIRWYVLVQWWGIVFSDTKVVTFCAMLCCIAYSSLPDPSVHNWSVCNKAFVLHMYMAVLLHPDNGQHKRWSRIPNNRPLLKQPFYSWLSYVKYNWLVTVVKETYQTMSPHRRGNVRPNLSNKTYHTFKTRT